MKVYQLPEASRGARGRPIVNLLPLEANERITAILPVKEYDADKYVFFATANGTVKKTSLSDFSRPLSSGIRAINLKEGDELIGVDITDGSNEIMLFSDAGKVVRFAEGSGRADADATDEVDTDDDAGNDDDGSDNGEGTESKGTFKGVRPMGRTAAGVRGIKLGKDDEVVSLSLLYHSDATSAEARTYLKQASAIRRAESGETEAPVEAEEDAEEGVEEATLTAERYAALGAREQFVLTMSQTGFGKRSSSYEYRVTGRGGSGIVAIGMGKKNSAVIGSFPVEESDDLMLISDAGQTIRVAVSGISIQGRAAQGVTVFRVDEGEKVVSVERIADVGGSE
jgi:DNA gyrase subunit A